MGAMEKRGFRIDAANFWPDPKGPAGKGPSRRSGQAHSCETGFGEAGVSRRIETGGVSGRGMFRQRNRKKSGRRRVTSNRVIQDRWCKGIVWMQTPCWYRAKFRRAVCPRGSRLHSSIRRQPKWSSASSRGNRNSLEISRARKNSRRPSSRRAIPRRV